MSTASAQAITERIKQIDRDVATYRAQIARYFSTTGLEHFKKSHEDNIRRLEAERLKLERQKKKLKLQALNEISNNQNTGANE